MTISVKWKLWTLSSYEDEPIHSMNYFGHASDELNHSTLQLGGHLSMFGPNAVIIQCFLYPMHTSISNIFTYPLKLLSELYLMTFVCYFHRKSIKYAFKAVYCINNDWIDMPIMYTQYTIPTICMYMYVPILYAMYELCANWKFDCCRGPFCW